MNPFLNYLRIARFDHWIKNIFMIPGCLIAISFTGLPESFSFFYLFLGFFAAGCAASANYTINEYLDADFDRHHPVKKKRPSVLGLIKPHWVIVQYITLAGIAIFISSFMNPMFMVSIVVLMIMGLIYNVPPIRSKNRIYMDVLSESINNPLRLVLGWSLLTTIIIPPLSLIVSYWMAGAFLMAAKRVAEYRLIDDPSLAGKYRESFKHYTDTKLLLSAFFYALTSMLFLGVFLIKYKVEFILLFPAVAFLFVWYLHLTLKNNETGISPEKMYLNPSMIMYCIFLLGLGIILFYVDLPFMTILVTNSTYTDMQVNSWETIWTFITP